MKKVLLFADVGGHDDQQYYHVGDEAMFYETYRWYRQSHSDWQLTMFSWFPTHSELEIVGASHLHWQKKRSHLYFPLLLIKLICWWLLRISFFSSAELALVKVIQKQDRVHFTGGGNLSTQFRQWLYYSFFVLITAKLTGKEIILTSQTIGPITGIDRLFAFFTLNLPQLIAIRARTNQRTEFKKHGVFLPKIRSMLDAAYTLPISHSNIKKMPKKDFVIGLSVHAWNGWEEEGVILAKRLLTNLAKKHFFSVILIPHHLTANEEGTDITYMKKITTDLSKQIQVSAFTFSKIPSTELVPASYIKKLTSQVDLLITTRYHGLVFGLSQNVPTIALQFDEYYQSKNSGALEIFFGNRKDDYQVSVINETAFEELNQKTLSMLQNNVKEKALLKRINRKLTKDGHTLNSILTEFEALH